MDRKAAISIIKSVHPSLTFRGAPTAFLVDLAKSYVEKQERALRGASERLSKADKTP